MIREALISDCGQYRYALLRSWDHALPALVYIMLNPSTADGKIDDATIRICVGRAIRMGCGSIKVVNLFAYRATRPADMVAASDPIGPSNDNYIASSIDPNNTKMVIAAWGSNGKFKMRDLQVVCQMSRLGVDLYCLGETKDGSPKHPLRIAYAVEPKLWRAA
jgi:hypothetical protein